MRAATDDQVTAEAGGRKPLAGKVVLITRAREQASAFARLLEAAGARVLLVPTIAIEPPDSWEPLDAALRDDFSWVVFTSVNGVTMVRGRVEATGHGRALLEPPTSPPSGLPPPRRSPTGGCARKPSPRSTSPMPSSIGSAR
jgi:hypothetical protein